MASLDHSPGLQTCFQLAIGHIYPFVLQVPQTMHLSLNLFSDPQKLLLYFLLEV